MTPLYQSVAAFLAMHIVGTIVHVQYLRNMRRKFPTFWQALGRPTVMQDILLLDAFQHVRWLWRKRYLETGDPGFINHCSAYRWPFVICYFLCIATLGVLLYHARHLMPSHQSP